MSSVIVNNNKCGLYSRSISWSSVFGMLARCLSKWQNHYLLSNPSALAKWFCPGKKYTPEYSTLDNYLIFDCKLMACYSELELVGPYFRACIVSIPLQSKQSPNIKTKVPLHYALTYTMPKVEWMATNRHCLLFFLSFFPKKSLKHLRLIRWYWYLGTSSLTLAPYLNKN